MADFALGQSVSLTVNKTGNGTVTSSPAGISCGASCSATFPPGTVVTLTAAAATGYRFSGWSGACTGTGGCSVTLTATTTVGATFTADSPGTATLTVSKLGTGAGTVTSTPPGINCGSTCAWSYQLGAIITLTASPAPGSVFAGWGGACSGTGSCTTTLSTARSVTATFNATAMSFADDFNRPAGSNIGPGWTVAQGTFWLADGMLWNGGAKTRHIAVQTSIAPAAGTVSAEFVATSTNRGGSIGLVFSYRDALNYYAAFRQIGGTARIKIVRVANGHETALATRSCHNPQRGASFDMALAFSADRATLTVGSCTVTATGLAVNAGPTGIAISGNGTSFAVDSFRVGP